jgi:uncharacterized protein YcbK (DUF882 family)
MFCLKDVGRQPQAMSCNRREFLRIGSGIAATLMLPPGLAKAASHTERSLSFYHTHTGEKIKTCYWAEGDYVEEGVREINQILRDHRTGEVYDMDQGLLDLLYLLQARVENTQSFQIISGYRSPKTNAMLSSKSKGVAKRSYHMQGKAIDIRLNGCDLKQLHKAALSLKAGGVGYYPSSDFIHVDVGRVRRW